MRYHVSYVVVEVLIIVLILIVFIVELIVILVQHVVLECLSGEVVDGAGDDLDRCMILVVR